MSNDQKALLIDITRCIGCRACMEACKEIHGFSGDPFDVEDLSATDYCAMRETDDGFIRRMCMHCRTPSCASVCPVGALEKTEEGPVTYDPDKCMGCRYCIQACPFSVPRYQWDSRVPAVAKCDMCIDRIRAGEKPACVEACMPEATVFGNRKELLAEAHRRIDENPDDYYPHVYGENEVGGTSVLFLSPVSFASLGFNMGLGEKPLEAHTLEALERVPGIVTVGGALLLAIWWITNRREKVALAEAAEARSETAGPEDPAGGPVHTMTEKGGGDDETR
jgi:formate dehydrogenase iron-sulfur subunit